MASVLSALLPRVRNLVRYLVRGDDIDDIAQDALIAIARGLGGYRGEGAFEAWADRIVARVTFAAIRDSRRERLRIVVDEEAASHVPGPDEVYEARRRAVEVLDALSYDVRHAVVLHHVLG